MKTIHLRDKNYNWKMFEYENISDISEELVKRKISIGDSASIGDRASIGYRASIGNSASIGNEVKLLTGFYITGTKHSVTYVGENKLSIGCHCLKISQWKKKFKDIGENEGYTDTQIKEYYQYILMAEKFAKIK